MSKENDDDPTVSKVYETLRSPTFLNNLYFDILSTIKEKNSYKLMRQKAEKLIAQKMAALEPLTDSKSDDVIRKVIVAQICTMSYTIDTVYSKILYMKLQKALKSEISGLVQELRTEGKIPDEIWSRLTGDDKVPSPKPAVEKSSLMNGCKDAKTKISDMPVSGPRKRKGKQPVHNAIDEDLKKINDTNNKETTSDSVSKEILSPKENSTGRIDGTTFYAFPEKKISKVTAKAPIKRGTKTNSAVLPNVAADETITNMPQTSSQPDNEVFPKTDVSEASTSTVTTKLTLKNSAVLPNAIADETFAKMDKNSSQLYNQADASDAESELSVSSVHTSDLSSFDDEISLSSEDDHGERKKYSLKEVQARLSRSFNTSLKTAEKSNDTQKRKSPEPEETPKEEVVKSKKQDNKETSKEETVKSKKQDNKETLKEEVVKSKKQDIKETPKEEVVKSKKQDNKETAKEEVAKSKKLNNKEAPKEEVVKSKKQDNKDGPSKKTIESNKQENANIKEQVPMEDTTSSNIVECTPTKSPIELPKRTRKPNSRYASESIICESIKLNEKPSLTSLKNTKSNKDISPKRKKQKMDTIQVSKETPKMMDTTETNIVPDVKSPAKQCESSNLHKPHSEVRSLTSRRTAPLTLYSTAT